MASFSLGETRWEGSVCTLGKHKAAARGPCSWPGVGGTGLGRAPKDAGNSPTWPRAYMYRYKVVSDTRAGEPATLHPAASGQVVWGLEMGLGSSRRGRDDRASRVAFSPQTLWRPQGPCPKRRLSTVSGERPSGVPGRCLRRPRPVTHEEPQSPRWRTSQIQGGQCPGGACRCHAPQKACVETQSSRERLAPSEWQSRIGQGGRSAGSVRCLCAHVNSVGWKHASSTGVTGTRLATPACGHPLQNKEALTEEPDTDRCLCL